MLRWLVTLGMALALFWGAWSEGWRVYAWAVRRSADRVYYRGDLDGALVRYQRVCELLPGVPRSHIDLANAVGHALEGGLGREMPVEEYERLTRLAARHYLEAIRTGPPNAWSYAGLGSLVENLRDARIREAGIDLSVLSGERLADLRPEDRLCEAAAVKAVQIEPRNYYYRDFLGEFYLRRGFEDRALAHFRVAARLHPVLERHPYLARRAEIAPAVLAAVEAGIEEALASDDTVVAPYDIYRFLSAVYMRMGRFDEAMANLERAAAVAPVPHVVDVQIGVLLAREGDDEGALEAFQRAAERRPDFYRAWYHMGLALSRLERHDEAVAAEVQARGLNPTDYRTSWALARVLQAAGRLNEAAAVLEQLQHTHPDREQPQLQLIRIYEQLGRLSQAARTARELAARHPQDPVFREQLEQLEKAMAETP